MGRYFKRVEPCGRCFMTVGGGYYLTPSCDLDLCVAWFAASSHRLRLTGIKLLKLSFSKKITEENYEVNQIVKILFGVRSGGGPHKTSNCWRIPPLDGHYHGLPKIVIWRIISLRLLLDTSVRCRIALITVVFHKCVLRSSSIRNMNYFYWQYDILRPIFTGQRHFQPLFCCYP